MGAEILRRAAALMRERAEAATPGPWVYLYPDQCCRDGCIQSADDCHVTEPTNDERDARHIASWHPDVALAVADWLDGLADLGEKASLGWDMPENHPALAVARAYLGERP